MKKELVVGRSEKMYPSPEKEYQNHDKLFIQGHEKNYPPLPPVQDKNYPQPHIAEKTFPLPTGPSKSFPHPPGPDKVYLPPSTAPPPLPNDRSYPVDDRSYPQMPRPHEHTHTQMGGGRVDPMFSDAGPADLTVAGPRSDIAATRPPLSDHQVARDDPYRVSRQDHGTDILTISTKDT